MLRVNLRALSFKLLLNKNELKTYPQLPAQTEPELLVEDVSEAENRAHSVRKVMFDEQRLHGQSTQQPPASSVQFGR